MTELPKPPASKPLPLPPPDKFEPCFRFVMRKDVEGGFVNNPKDPGGATNKGVTIGTLSSWRGYKCTVDDVMGLTDAEAKEIYRTNYYNAIRGDDLPVGLDLMVFDFAVNAGPKRAILTLQKLVYVKPDGGMGPVTLKGVAGYNTRALVVQYAQARQAFYASLANFTIFGRGWTNRVENSRNAAFLLMGI